MEDHPRRSEEGHFELFLRLIDEEDVRTFVVFWPLAARLHGLEVELGHLLTRLSDGVLDPGAVFLLVEKRVIGTGSSEGTIAWSEPGNRTRYHEDLVARGCRVRRWHDPESLWAQMGSIVLEHQLRTNPRV